MAEQVAHTTVVRVAQDGKADEGGRMDLLPGEATAIRGGIRMALMEMTREGMQTRGRATGMPDARKAAVLRESMNCRKERHSSI